MIVKSIFEQKSNSLDKSSVLSIFHVRFLQKKIGKQLLVEVRESRCAKLLKRI